MIGHRRRFPLQWWYSHDVPQHNIQGFSELDVGSFAIPRTTILRMNDELCEVGKKVALFVPDVGAVEASIAIRSMWKPAEAPDPHIWS
jgi:hypothetical protein